MTNLKHNNTRELGIDERDAVVGGTLMDTVHCVTAAVSAINDISGVLAKAVDGIPPATCHPK